MMEIYRMEMDAQSNAWLKMDIFVKEAVHFQWIYVMSIEKLIVVSWCLTDLPQNDIMMSKLN